MDEIKELIQKLQHTEKEKDKASQRLEYVVDEAVKEMISILYALYPSLKREGLTIRNYKGQIYEIKDGVVVYAKGIDEKVILDNGKKLIRYQSKNDDFIEEEVNPQKLLSEIGFENIYNNIKELLRERIRLNNEEILNFRNQTSKIEKYVKELEQEYKMN